ncbi:MAG: flagellar hook-basal body complex protein FliE [bacterium]
MAKIDAIQAPAFNQLLKQEDLSINKKDVPKFSETLQGLVGQVDALHNASGDAIKEFIAGKDIHLHEVMALGEEAQISFQFMLEVRNKLVEAYQELSRMQV